jgi:hypothetical protein
MISFALARSAFDVRHILPDGRLETNAEVEQRLMQRYGLATEQAELFGAGDATLALEDAYRRRGREIAYRPAAHAEAAIAADGPRTMRRG